MDYHFAENPQSRLAEGSPLSELYPAGSKPRLDSGCSV